MFVVVVCWFLHVHLHSSTPLQQRIMPQTRSMKLPINVKSSATKIKKYKSPAHGVIALAAATATAYQSVSGNPIQYSQVEAFQVHSRSLSRVRTLTPSLKTEKSSRYFAKKRNVEVKLEDDTDTSTSNLDELSFARPQLKQEVTADTDDVTNVVCRVFATSNAREVENVSTKEDVPRTQSFDVLWHGALHPTTSIKIHTLILGTHPSITSLEKSQYYGHAMNAFWWIAGDCLGFRRDSGISPSSGKPYKLASQIIHGEDRIIPYEEQLEVMTSKGFAMWDLLGSCERKGSLDNDIKQETPNAIREFCQQHPTINRIIMANGAKQCTFFNRYFEDWWLSGELKPGDSELSTKAFKKWSKKTDGFKGARIEVNCMPGVSPAAASVPYERKRDAFKLHCYDPGLSDHKELNQNKPAEK